MSDKKQTTETILEQLKNAPFQNIILHAQDRQYSVSVPMIKALAWAAIPDLIKDENSEIAKKNQLLRTGLKTLIRPMLPQILKHTWGEGVEITPRLNVLNWVCSYFVHLIVNVIATREWIIHVEKVDDASGENRYRILGVSAKSDNNECSNSLPSPASDTHKEPLSGGG